MFFPLLRICDQRPAAESFGAGWHPEPSHVLRAMALSTAAAWSSVRFSFGEYNSPEEIGSAAELLVEIVAKLRRFGVRRWVALACVKRASAELIPWQPFCADLFRSAGQGPIVAEQNRRSPFTGALPRGQIRASSRCATVNAAPSRRVAPRWGA